MRRLVSPLLFLAVAASFVLPFLEVTSVGRRASASGVDLVTAGALVWGGLRLWRDPPDDQPEGSEQAAPSWLR